MTVATTVFLRSVSSDVMRAAHIADLVAARRSGPFVDDDQPIGVAVEGDADRRAAATTSPRTCSGCRAHFRVLADIDLFGFTPMAVTRAPSSRKTSGATL